MSNSFALITGASSGIGREMTKLLAEKEYNLLLVSNDEIGLSQVKDELVKNSTIEVRILTMDLSSQIAALEIFNYCSKNELNIDVLINNAGLLFFSEIVEADYPKAQELLMLHMLTTSQLCQLIGRQMKEKGRGHILNVSSISAYRAFPGIGHYGSSKAYLKNFSLSLRTELKPHHVVVSCLCPGATTTNLYDPNVIDMERAKKLGIMMDAKSVATSGINGLFANKAIVIPGLLTKIMLLFAMITPQFVYQFIWNQKFAKRS